MQQNVIHDRQYSGNVLIAWKTGFGKTCFMQKLAVNDFFGKIVKVEWVSSIQLSRTREAEIQSGYTCDVSCYYSQTLETFVRLGRRF